MTPRFFDRGATDLPAFGRELEACRHYLTRVAERSIPGPLRAKLAASDLVQETFVDACRRADDLRARRPDELRAWLYGIMLLNLAERRRKFLGTAKADVRREARQDSDSDRPGDRTHRIADDRPTPSTAAMENERIDRLAGALSTLRENDRALILWRYREGLGFAEIGRRLGGRSEDAVRMQFHRACRRLHRIMGGESP